MTSPIPTQSFMGKWQPHGWKFWERRKKQGPAATATPTSTPTSTPVPTSAPSSGPTPAPTPVTIPTTQTPATEPLITTPGAAPLTYPITNMWFPESLEAPPIRPVGGPLPPIQTYAPPPPPPAAPPPRPYVPGQPLPVTDWFGICAQRARGL